MTYIRDRLQPLVARFRCCDGYLASNPLWLSVSHSGGARGPIPMSSILRSLRPCFLFSQTSPGFCRTIFRPPSRLVRNRSVASFRFASLRQDHRKTLVLILRQSGSVPTFGFWLPARFVVFSSGFCPVRTLGSFNVSYSPLPLSSPALPLSPAPAWTPLRSFRTRKD